MRDLTATLRYIELPRIREQYTLGPTTNYDQSGSNVSRADAKRSAYRTNETNRTN